MTRLVCTLALAALAACSSTTSTPDAGSDAPLDARLVCSPGCSIVQLCCDIGASRRCVDYYSDPSNCGGCGIACASDELCVDRACVAR